MFQEKYLIYKERVPKSEQQKETPLSGPDAGQTEQDDVKKRADFFQEKMEREARLYEKAGELVLMMGYAEDDIDEILNDETNPYLDEIWNFAEKIETGEVRKLKVEKYKDGIELHFRLRDDERLFGVHINQKLQIALRWKKLIYPTLQKIAKGYEKELKTVIAAGGTPAYQQLVYTLAKWDILNVNQDKRLQDELRAIRKGKSIEDLWEEAEEKRKTEEALDRIEPMEKILLSLSPEELAESRREIEEDRIRRQKRHERIVKRRDELFAEENQAYDEALKPYMKEGMMPGDGYLELSKEQLPGFMAEMDFVEDQIVEKEPRLDRVREEIAKLFPDIQALIEAGVPEEEIGHFIDAHDSLAEYEAIEKTMEESNDIDGLAALSAYKETVEARLGGLGSAYGMDID